MLSFIKKLMRKFVVDSSAGFYDEDGKYVDPYFAKLTNDELMLPANIALMMNNKALEDMKIKNRKRIFRQIHSQIKVGKTELRLESHVATEDVLAYLDTMGYRVRRITPTGTSGAFVPVPFFDSADSEQLRQPYHYYVVNWGPVGTKTDPGVNISTVTTLTMSET